MNQTLTKKRRVTVIKSPVRQYCAKFLHEGVGGFLFVYVEHFISNMIDAQINSPIDQIKQKILRR
jgi:hypothetical protein